MERLEIMRWLDSKGFVELPFEGQEDHVIYQKEDQVRVVFKKKVVRVEGRRSLAMRMKSCWDHEWMRIGGAYYKNLKINETGMIIGLGFVSIEGLKEYINKV